MQLKRIFHFHANLFLIFVNFSCFAENNNFVTQQEILDFAHQFSVPVYSYRVVKTYSHYPNAFTEGLVLENNILYESSGLYNQSKIIKMDINKGIVLHEYALPPQYFAEGIAIIGHNLYQLTYQSQIGFVYDKNTFKIEKTFSYRSEGWGLTTDGKQLIMSNGSATLSFLDINSLKITRQIVVHYGNRKIYLINALQYINDKIYANIFKTDLIAIISPQSGVLVGLINLTNIYPQQKKDYSEVLNGIAYDKENNTILVTGKYWPYIYAIQLI